MDCIFLLRVFYYCSNNEHHRDTGLVTNGEHANVVSESAYRTSVVAILPGIGISPVILYSLKNTFTDQLDQSSFLQTEEVALHSHN